MKELEQLVSLGFFVSQGFFIPECKVSQGPAWLIILNPKQRFIPQYAPTQSMLFLVYLSNLEYNL